MGSGASFAYHRAKTAAVLSLAAMDAPNCICNHPAPFGQTKGSIEYFGPTNYTTCAPHHAQNTMRTTPCAPRAP